MPYGGSTASARRWSSPDSQIRSCRLQGISERNRRNVSLIAQHKHNLITESRQNMTFQIQEAMSSPTHAQDPLHLTSEAGLASMGRSFAWVKAFFSTSAVPGQQAMVKTRFAMSQIETCRSAQSSHILVPLNVWALQICQSLKRAMARILLLDRLASIV